MTHDSLKRRMVDLERESADALTRVEELSPLTAEVERLRSELRSERDAVAIKLEEEKAKKEDADPDEIKSLRAERKNYSLLKRLGRYVRPVVGG